MNTNQAIKASNLDRRSFLGVAAMSLAAVQFGAINSVSAQSNDTTAHLEAPMKPGTNTSFAPLKQIDAGLLNVGYAEAGPSDEIISSGMDEWVPQSGDHVPPSAKTMKAPPPGYISRR